MLKRVLAAAFGALLFGVLVPLVCALTMDGPDELMGFVWLAVAGVVVGAALGWMLPRVFGFVFEVFFEI